MDGGVIVPTTAPGTSQVLSKHLSMVHLLVTLGLKWPALGGMRFLGVRTMESQCDSSLASLGPSAWRCQASPGQGCGRGRKPGAALSPSGPRAQGQNPQLHWPGLQSFRRSGTLATPALPQAACTHSWPTQQQASGRGSSRSEQDSVALARRARSPSPSPERTGRLVLSDLGR